MKALLKKFLHMVLAGSILLCIIPKTPSAADPADIVFTPSSPAPYDFEKSFLSTGFGSPADTVEFNIRGPHLSTGAVELFDGSEPGPIGNVVVTLGNQIFAVPGDKFITKKNAQICKKVATGSGIVTAKFNPVKCTFVITIKKTTINSTSGEVTFGISAFGSFNKTLEVDLD